MAKFTRLTARAKFPRLAVGALVASSALTWLAPVGAQATESLGVAVAPYTSVYGGGDGAETNGDSALTALYVDSSGAAHVAYASDSTVGDVILCTIPAGGSSCGSQVTLHTDGTTSGEPVVSLKYLSNGSGSAILAVGLDLLTGTPSFSSGGVTAPYSETEIFQPGSTTGVAIGSTYDSGGGNAGDEIYIPNENGIDVVGEWSDYVWPPVGVYNPANAYEFESFTSPSSTDVGPTFLGVEAGQGSLPAGELLPGEWPAGVTELADGATAVIGYYLDETAPSSFEPVTAPVTMRVAPEGSNTFGNWQNLGISGPIETDFAPSASTYLINGVSTDPTAGGAANPPEDLELYEFVNSSLKWLGNLGATDSNIENTFESQAQWDTMPPSYEDSSGDLYAAWYASGGDDACPYSSTDTQTSVDACLMYREVLPGGVFGPKIVLSEDYEENSYDKLDNVAQISANSAGAGWVLVWREPGLDGTRTLYAEPLSAAATVPTAPAVDGTAVSVPLTCAGTGSCSLAASLNVAAEFVKAGVARRGQDTGHAASSSIVVARATEVIRGGHRRRVVLVLNRAGRALLRREHGRLSAQLTVVQHVGLNRARRIVYDGPLTLR